MTSYTYATLDRNRLGPGLLLDDSDLQITTSIACDGARKVLGSLPVMSGEYAYECYVWSTSQGDLSGLVSIGVAQPNSVLNAAVGNDAASVGYWPADGVVKSNGSTLGSPGKTPERKCLGVRLLLSPTSATCEFRVDGALLYTATLPTGKAWLPAIGLGGSSAGDILASVNFGVWRFDGFDSSHRAGWSQQTSGLATITLSLTDEAFHSSPADSPANTPFGPYVLNGDKLGPRRSVRPWWLRDSSGGNPAALTSILLDNSAGSFNDLLRADVRDSPILIDMPSSGRGGAGSLAAAERLFTGFVDSVALNKRNQVELRLRDQLTAFDRTAWMRRVPPWCDPSSAGKTVPLHRGARRNVEMLLWSKPDRIWLIGDAPMTNITMVSDKAAPLDPLALPPQYVPALNHCGVKLQTDFVGRGSVDCSNVGEQYEIPGAQDVLGGIGLFASWSVPILTDTTTPPSGCTFSAIDPGSKLVKWAVLPTTILRLKSMVTWAPGAGKYGEWLKIGTTPLLGGRSYRLTFVLYGAISNSQYQYGQPGGLMFRTKLSSAPADAISSHGVPIVQSSSVGKAYTLDFTVPIGASRDLYMIVAAGSDVVGGVTPNGLAFADVRAVAVELLGQYQALPLEDQSIDSLLHDVFVTNEGEAPTVYNAADAVAVGEDAGHGLGLSYYDPPKLLDVLTQAADQFGAIIFTDEFGQIRMRRFRMPSANSTPVAAFNASNVDLTSVSIQRIKASSLTTSYACRPNVRPLTDADYVSDTDTVMPTMREAYKGDGQISFSSTVHLAREYVARDGAPRRLLQIDDPAPARNEADFACSTAKVPLDLVTFDVYADGLDVGTNPSVRMQKLYGGDFIRVNLPQFGLRNALLTVVDTQPFPLAGKMTIGAVVGEIR